MSAAAPAVGWVSDLLLERWSEIRKVCHSCKLSACVQAAPGSVRLDEMCRNELGSIGLTQHAGHQPASSLLLFTVDSDAEHNVHIDLASNRRSQYCHSVVLLWMGASSQLLYHHPLSGKEGVNSKHTCNCVLRSSHFLSHVLHGVCTPSNPTNNSKCSAGCHCVLLSFRRPARCCTRQAKLQRLSSVLLQLQQCKLTQVMLARCLS